VPNYYATDGDRTTGLRIFRRMRDMFASDALAPLVDHETLPGASVQDDQAIIDMALEHGYCGYHAVRTCAMGPDETDVVDSTLRVRGVEGLRIMDCSILPVMVSGNLNGPMMAMAHAAADVIRDSRRAGRERLRELVDEGDDLPGARHELRLVSSARIHDLLSIEVTGSCPSLLPTVRQVGCVRSDASRTRGFRCLRRG
jgi:hypothetical protein